MQEGIMKIAIVLTAAFAAAQAQDSTKTQPVDSEKIQNVEGKVDGLNESYLETKTTVDKLAKIKVSGYIQAQWQHSDSIGGPSVAGGGFPVNSDRRFAIRRGRLKTVYEQPTSKYSLEFEAVPTGVSIKDMNVTLMEPWLKTFDLALGVMDRPFGFEIGYSSSLLETPERTRFEQAYMNGEKDLGAQLAIHPTDMGTTDYLNFKGGLFTGMGGNVNENDRNLDFIGRLGFKAPFTDLNLDIDGGFSMYMGKVENVSDTSYAMGDTSFLKSGGHRFQAYDRKVMGVDAQLYYDIPVIGGASFRVEYNWGEMPSNFGANVPYVPSVTAAIPAVGPNSGAANLAAANVAANYLQMRNMMGWYLTWVQNLGSQLQAVVRYDVFDPNTDVKGSNIHGGANNLSAADIMYSTLGLGGIYHWDGNLKFVAYYDMVTNEKTGGLAPYTADLNDNVFTFRAQVKF